MHASVSSAFIEDGTTIIGKKPALGKGLLVQGPLVQGPLVQNRLDVGIDVEWFLAMRLPRQ
jgi:hypothetical protein